MPLSLYLTDAEWDACFYAYFGQHRAPDFASSMHMTIRYLIRVGYRFQGLDEDGSPAEQVPSRNDAKLCLLLGAPTNLSVPDLLDSGRTFLKRHAPSLVDESDEEWAAQRAAAHKTGT